jgi:acetyl esterase/lipase
MKPLLAAALLVFASAAAARAASDVGIDVRQNITYYDGEGADKYRNRLDLYLPSGPRDVPAVIFVHGGGWTTGIKDQYTQIGRFFAAHGVAAAVINYRLSPTVAFPGQVEDVARAFAWVKAHIHEYGGRADAIFLCGHSAGAHLIALVATDPTYLRTVGASLADVKGVIPISGVYTASPRLGLFAAGPPPDAATLQRASPIAHAVSDPVWRRRCAADAGGRRGHDAGPRGCGVDRPVAGNRESQSHADGARSGSGWRSGRAAGPRFHLEGIVALIPAV